MTDPFCPNLNNCKFINSAEVNGLPERDYYMSHYCRSNDSCWKNCKRFEIKAVLGFCPDFVLPDSRMTIDQIIEMFDEQSK